MCGITTYCGNGEALPFLMQGLAKLEYRGYDSAGVTVLNNVLTTVKCKGRLKNLEEKLKGSRDDWSCRYWSYQMGNSWCPF